MAEKGVVEEEGQVEGEMKGHQRGVRRLRGSVVSAVTLATMQEHVRRLEKQIGQANPNSYN